MQSGRSIHGQTILRRHSILVKEALRFPWYPTDAMIEGTVKNSIIGRGVIIKKGAVVENSVILPGVTIGEDMVVKYAVVDKKVKAITQKRTDW